MWRRTVRSRLAERTAERAENAWGEGMWVDEWSVVAEREIGLKAFFLRRVYCSRATVSLGRARERPPWIRVARSARQNGSRRRHVKCARQASLDTPVSRWRIAADQGRDDVVFSSDNPQKIDRRPGAHLLRDDIGLLRRVVGGDTERGKAPARAEAEAIFVVCGSDASGQV